MGVPRRLVLMMTAAALVVGGVASGPLGSGTARAAGWSGLRAGVGVADATWHVGAGAGQYASDERAELKPDPKRAEWDPNYQHVKQSASYGVASRLSIR